MKLLAALAFCGLLSAQTTTLTLTGPASVTAGGNFVATLAVSGSASQGIVALQWSMGLPAGFAIGQPTVSSTDPTGDTGTCGVVICLLYGSLTALADGTLATIPVAVASTATPGTQTIPLSGIFAATADGLNVNGLVAGSPLSIKVLSPCDLNGDGVVNVADVQLIVAAIVSGAACPVSVANGGCSILTLVQEVVAATGGACKI